MRSAFDNPAQIKEDFANHAEKWEGFFITIYVFLYLIQIGYVMIIMGYTFVRGCADENEIRGFVADYSVMQAALAHLYMTAALFQSAFIVFQFNEHCIYSQNPSQVQLLYQFKNVAIIYFSLGFFFIVLYVLSLDLNKKLIQLIVQSQFEGQSKVLISAILVELMISTELFIEFSFYHALISEFPHNLNKYLNGLVYSTLIYHFITSYTLPIIYIYNIFKRKGCNIYFWRRFRNKRLYIQNRKETIEESNFGSFQEIKIERREALTAGTTNTKLTLNMRGSLFFCTICLDVMTHSDDLLKITQCNHIFHKQCMYRWGEINMNCPICRQDIY